MVDDDALIIAGLFADDSLGSELLVVDEGTFKRLASKTEFQGEDVYSLEVDLESPSSAWKPYVVAVDGLGQRLMEGRPASSVSAVDLTAEQVDRPNQRLGFLGESEVIRLLAQSPQLDLFRPFPDIEMVEVLARDHQSRRYCGIQVKTASVSAARAHEAEIHVHKRTLAPSDTTYVVALAWLPEPGRFSDECLLIPSTEISLVAIDVGDVWELKFHPHSARDTRLDPYRLPLAQLGERVGELIG